MVNFECPKNNACNRITLDGPLFICRSGLAQRHHRNNKQSLITSLPDIDKDLQRPAKASRRVVLLPRFTLILRIRGEADGRFGEERLKRQGYDVKAPLPLTPASSFLQSSSGSTLDTCQMLPRDWPRPSVLFFLRASLDGSVYVHRSRIDWKHKNDAVLSTLAHRSPLKHCRKSLREIL